ncbi:MULTISPECIES: SRPBCC family protein [unclassified Nocardioides]|uniref:SRPBCC family protein n=1 Tax=unclassified Nocardioides TaxID=2615069 RepID=UPI003014782A
MPSVERTIEVDQPIAKVWDYVSDFRSTEEWDPPTVSTVRTSGDGGVGTTYVNTSSFLGHETQVEYRVTEFVPQSRLQLAGDAGKSLDLLDTITVESTATGTRLTYHAEFTTSGAAKLTEPLLPPALKILGDRVAESLRDHLTRL